MCIAHHDKRVRDLTCNAKITYIATDLLLKTGVACANEFLSGVVCNDGKMMSSSNNHEKATGRIVFMHPKTRTICYLSYISDIVAIDSHCTKCPCYIEVLKVFHIEADEAFPTFIKTLGARREVSISVDGVEYAAYPQRDFSLTSSMKLSCKASGVILNHNVVYHGENGKTTTTRSLLIPRSLLPTRTRILIIDDSRLSIQCLSEMLNCLGYFNIDEAFNGNEAYRYLDENQYQIVFIDIDLPDVSGNEVAEFIKNKYSGSYTVGYTASQVDNSYFDSVITKPILATQLSQILRKTVQFKT